MNNKAYLIIAKNTAGMLAVNKILIDNNIVTDLVPTPPETGTVCAIAVKINEKNLLLAKSLLEDNKIDFENILEERKMKLAGLLEKKLFNAVTEKFIDILKKLEIGSDLMKDEIVYLLKTDNKKEIATIYEIANRIRKETVGDIVDIRGAIEFSNYCKKSCKYCGINADNKSILRYRMGEEEILATVLELHNIGLKTVILQSGEDDSWSTPRLVKLLKKIKEKTNMRITLSVGERTKEDYEELKKAGANNFLLKIETTNKKIFKNIHPDDDYDKRVQCAKWLKELGYITGSGNIIGLPEQTEEDIASDILYFKDMGINMIGIGPFIPAKGTAFENMPVGSIELTLRTVAVTRIVCKKVFLPSTTALASLDKDAQIMALKAGANTIMLISTPLKYRENYCIYDNKNMVDLDAAFYAVEKAGRHLPEYLKV